MRSESKFAPTLSGLLIMLGGAAAFVLISGSRLPPVVASHFGPGSGANGFMSRNVYLAFMLIGTVVMPLLMVLPQRLVRIIPPRLINVPNREYWLAPERLDATLDYLRDHAMWFAMLFTLFLCFVHWEVVQANLRTPARLAPQPFIAGLLAYMAGIVVWMVALGRHFRRPRDIQR